MKMTVNLFQRTRKTTFSFLRNKSNRRNCSVFPSLASSPFSQQQFESHNVREKYLKQKKPAEGVVIIIIEKRNELPQNGINIKTPPSNLFLFFRATEGKNSQCGRRQKFHLTFCCAVRKAKKKYQMSAMGIRFPLP
jgi:hypothetical protein